MNDEHLLRGYRPTGPPSELRGRILHTSGSVRLQADQNLTRQTSLRDWLPAIAAAGLIVILQVLAAGVRDRVYDQIATPNAPTPVEISLQ